MNAADLTELRAARRRLYTTPDPTSWDDIDLDATIAAAVDNKLAAMDNGCHGHLITGITAHRPKQVA